MKILPQSITDLIDEFSNLPGIGPKSAARVVFFLQKAPQNVSKSLADKISKAVDIDECERCFNLSEGDRCSVCLDEAREEQKILVVEDPLDLIAIERVGVYKGFYHVLGGIISPMNGVGPDEIRIRELIKRLNETEKEIELIIATNPDMEGEATAIYIQNEIKNSGSLSKKVEITRLARGLATGADIDYTDETTIRRAIEGRVKM